MVIALRALAALQLWQDDAGMTLHHINSLDDFRALEGKELFASDPVRVTEQLIHHFCRGTLNEEWIHWDRDRAKASHLGDIIAPGLLLPALYPGIFWQHMEINLPRMIVKGIDGIRIFRPVLVDTEVTARARVAEVLDRSSGIEVRYEIKFYQVDVEPVLAEVTFINRYWDD